MQAHLQDAVEDCRSFSQAAGCRRLSLSWRQQVPTVWSWAGCCSSLPCTGGAPHRHRVQE